MSSDSIGADLLDEVRAASVALGEARERRDAAIRAAFQWGHPRQRIADHAGMTRDGVYKLLSTR